MKSDAAILWMFGTMLQAPNAANPATIMGYIADNQDCTTLEVTQSLVRSARLLIADFGEIVDFDETVDEAPALSGGFIPKAGESPVQAPAEEEDAP